MTTDSPQAPWGASGRSCGRGGKREGKIPCGQRICREFGPFRQDTRRKGLGFEGLAAKFPAWASRELFCAQQGMCREFFAWSREFRAGAEKRRAYQRKNGWIAMYLFD